MPPEHEAPVRAFYDHEEEEPRGTRRRRAVADWGVSEDVFDRMPGPRFSRRGEAPREVTRRREPARADDVRGGDEARFARGDEPRGDDARFVRSDAPRYVAREEVDEAPEQPKERVADDWFAEPQSVSRTIVIEREPGAADDDHGADYEPHFDDSVTSAARRTIVIGGHPDRLRARVRTPRTAVSRIGPKPDRIVAYAVALGVLLILIAILSSH
jgi:hypothetical protein